MADANAPDFLPKCTDPFCPCQDGDACHYEQVGDTPAHPLPPGVERINHDYLRGPTDGPRLARVRSMVIKELPAELRSPVSLPEGKEGNVEVKHTLRKNFEIVSTRETLLTGKEPLSVQLAEPITVHLLFEDNLLWIADWPIEVRQHREALERMRPRGHVLVGGLGLGIMACLLAEHPEVEHVTAVEIAPEVSRLCNPHRSNVEIITMDLRDYLRSLDEWEFDSAFIDIWRDTSEGAWWEEVLPIRRIIGKQFGPWVGGDVQYWAEDIMLGQVGKRLLRETQPHWYYVEELRLPMTTKRARWFIANAGTPAWERKYGQYLYQPAVGT
jgi:hypothetical protein